MRALPLTGVPGTFTRRFAGMTLIGQALAIGFGALVARGLALTDGDADAGRTYLIGGTILALLCVVAAGVLRRPFGITLGWLVQLLTLASALVLPAMLGVVAIFGALWVVSLVQGRKMEELSQRWAEEHGTTHDQTTSED
ncbi:DUF4233 domain-containing protein [Ornithinicoccus hortensis]|uniref:DUF4233 domain-containing protein n=1 Tax=Ornithinicoccus hortensis TaxID=82346 RepID=UPI001E4A26F6|nr:DUF4233 domain-containing protein [Ornithinicoccus hortensis]